MASHDDHNTQGGAGPATPTRSTAGRATVPTPRAITGSHDDTGAGGLHDPYLSPVPVAVTNAIG